MSILDSNWVKHPTKKQLILTIVIWMVGLSLSITNATDFYTKSLFVFHNVFLLFLWIFATSILIKVIRNYKNRRTITD